MFKVLLVFIISLSVSLASSFEFSELRYSDAIDKTIKLAGKISFTENGLHISYPKEGKSIEYKNDSIIYKENAEEIELDERQSRQLARYFDILLLLHQGDENAYRDMFEVSKVDDSLVLKPIGVLEDYIREIETLRDKKNLKYVKILLQNDDYIVITIYDEI